MRGRIPVAVALLAASAAAAAPSEEPARISIPIERAAKRMGEDEPKGMTAYCCDTSGLVRCSVNAPGPPGEPCFCAGVEPAGMLCVPQNVSAPEKRDK